MSVYLYRRPIRTVRVPSGGIVTRPRQALRAPDSGARLNAASLAAADPV
jgi:hypothetical protein